MTDSNVTYKLVVVPGDGIGPEVIAAGRRVIETAGRLFGFGFEWTEVLIGGVAIDAYGIPMRESDMAVCAAADAIYFGSIGDPKYDDPKAKVRPEQALLGLRKGLSLYANLRPVTVHPVLIASSPLTWPPGKPIFAPSAAWRYNSCEGTSDQSLHAAVKNL